MKRSICLGLVLAFVLCFTAGAYAQQAVPAAQTDELVAVKKSDLTADQLAKLKTQEIKETLGEYKDYADMGKGIGMAVGESLRAVKDVAVDFSKTDVGKYVMILIAWKVMAKDIIAMGNQVFGYLIGIPMLFFGTIVFIWSYRRQCFPHRVCVEKTKEGKKWAIVTPNGHIVDLEDVMGTTNSHKVEARALWAWAHAGVYFLYLIVCMTVIFA